MTIEITAAVLRSADGDYSLETATLADPRGDELLIRLEATGICHTDLVARGMVELPAVFGHEGTGVVEAVGANVSDFVIGDTVIMAYAFCGTCPHCQLKERYHCEMSFPLNFGGARLDGSKPISVKGEALASAFFQQSSFATHAVVPARDTVKVTSDLLAEIRAALPCGIATGSAAVTNVFHVGNGDSLLVFGVGSVGLSAILTARNMGAETIIAVDIHDSRLSLAQELGATTVINALSQDVAEAVRAVAPGGVKYAFDTSGASSVWDCVFSCLSMGGLFGFVTVPQPFEEFSFKPFTLVAKGIGIKFIIQGETNSQEIIQKLIEWHQEGRFEIERLVTVYPFKEINQAHSGMRDGSVIKPVLKMDEPDFIETSVHGAIRDYCL